MLPSLADNVKVGNSLISGSEENLRGVFGDDWKEKRPFNWGEQFEAIMGQGGFDIIIGNPPYLTEARGNKELFRELRQVPILQPYYEKNMDIFNYFVEIGLDLLKEGGLLGFIIPSYWQNRTGANKLRSKIVSESNILRLIDFGDLKVFSQALGHHSSIIILEKVVQSELTDGLKYLRVSSEDQQDSKTTFNNTVSLLAGDRVVQGNYELSANKLLVQVGEINALSAIKRKAHCFLNKETVIRGVDTSPSNHLGQGVFVLRDSEFGEMRKQLSGKELEFFKPFYRAQQVDRYTYESVNHFWLLYTDRRRKALVESEPDSYENIVAHLEGYRDVITSDNKPYGLHRPKKEENFLETNKLVFVRKTPYPKFSIVPQPYFFDESMYLILCGQDDVARYLLGILNSKVAHYWYRRHKRQGNQLQIDKEIILTLPIRKVDVTNDHEKSIRDSIIFKVDTMITFQARFSEIKGLAIAESNDLQLDISRADAEIDDLVFELYGLSEAEKRLVEEETA